jgi:hypothetical protein
VDKVFGTYRPVSEPVLQVDVPELVDHTSLSQDASLMGVGEKAHQRPRQIVVKR